MRIYAILVLLFFSLNGSAQSLRELYGQGKTAYDSGDYQMSLQKFVEFDQIRANYPPVNAYLAMLYARTENPQSSLDYLTRTAIINADTSLLSRSDFDPIRKVSGFSKVEQLFYEMLDSVQNSELAYVLEDSGFHPESMAFDPETSRFYLGSIRQRRILVYESGIFREFKTTAEDGLLAVTGLAIDAEAHVLWVASAYMKQMELREEGEVGSALHAYDLLTGDLLFVHRLPEEDILLGDLILDEQGIPVMTNSITPELYRANADSTYIWKAFPDLFNLQGLAINDDGLLYFSDYILGIYAFDGENHTRLNHGPLISTKGIDGLYFKRGNLIGMQNGVFPMRVTQFVLDESSKSIAEAIYLDKNIPDLNEPVQGTWVGDWFYFISNSPWQYYEDNVLNEERAPKTQIRRVNLSAHQ